MKVMLASDSGHAGRSNEDFVGAVPGAVVLLDGAGIPGTDSICRHGVAWFSQERDMSLAVYADVSQPGRINLGDRLQPG